MKRALRRPRVSILLPCHNAAAWLTDTIASVHAQSFRDCEIIAVDDGSTDATRAMLEAWARRDERVRVIGQPAAGLVAALQRATDAACGEILVRMDADDVAYSTRVARQVELLDANPGIGACGTLVRYFPRGVVAGGARRYEEWINALVTHDEIARDIFVECPIAHPTLAIRRAVLDQVGGYRDHGWPEDYDLVLRLWQHGVAMAKVPEILLRWRERSDRTSRIDPRYGEDAFRRVKVHYLANTLLRDRDGVVIWGAGPVGKAFAVELQAREHRVRAFVELDPRKLGQTIHGAPVIEPAGLDAFPGALIVAAVGQAGAREEIRAELTGRGLVDGVDFVAVA